MKRFIQLTIALVLFASPALAADGDSVSDADVIATFGSYYSLSYLLCDSKVAANSSCSEFDLKQTGVGMPDWIIFSRDTTTGCTSDPTIAINGQTTTGGTEHVIATLNNATTSARVQGPRNRFIDADITDDADCTDLDVTMTLFYKIQRVK